MFNSKLVGGGIQWPDMQMLFKFKVNSIKIEDFINLAYVDLKINRWLNSATWYANGLQILSQSDENWQF